MKRRYFTRPIWTSASHQNCDSPPGSGFFIVTDDVFVMNADGSAQSQLTTFAEHDKMPVFSPDSSQIAFSTGGALGGNAISVMTADGTDWQRGLNNVACEIANLLLRGEDGDVLL